MTFLPKAGDRIRLIAMPDEPDLVPGGMLRESGTRARTGWDGNRGWPGRSWQEPI